MKKLLTFMTLCFCATQAFATVQCIGVPDRVYAGYHGPYPSEQSFGVILKDINGRVTLGQVDSNLAQARYAMALAAKTTNTEVVIEFYHLSSPDNCSTAIATNALPTSMYSK